MKIKIEKSAYDRNRLQAEENLLILKDNNIRSIEILGPQGAGKTSIIEQLATRLKDRYQVRVIAGDKTTTIDRDRILDRGVLSIQIETGTCHLDAFMIKKALDEHENLLDGNILIIENVGNPICPTEYSLGAEYRLVVLSMANGLYQIQKHPFLIKAADITVINKIDLAEALELDPKDFITEVRSLNPTTKIIPLSAKTGEGIPQLITELSLD
ncbi:MAG: hydrogenase nickel incorporation protein HypB [Candidatus Hodarchaeota archaeon]